MNELLLRFLDDRASLSEAEAQELTARLEANPEALRDLRAQLVMDELLSRRADESRAVFVARVKSALRVQAAEAESFVAAVLRRLPPRSGDFRIAESSARRTRPAIRKSPLLGVGFAVAAALAVMAFFFLQKKTPPVRLATASGDVRVWRTQKTLAGKAGFVLQAGDWLLTGKDGAAQVEFPGETTRLAIGADAEFGVVTAMPDKQLKLTAGTMRASVARQSASHPMLIRTPTAKAEVLGTKFEMSATKERTEMTVTEGRVLIARTDDESGVVVETSQSATVTATEPVAVQTPPVAQLLDAGLLARWTFDEGAGLIAGDSSGHGHELKLSSEGAWGAGHSGGALDLHAAKVDVESPRLALPNAFTISLWVRLHQGGAPRPQPLMSCDGLAAGLSAFSLTVPPTFPGSGVVFEVSGPTMGSRAHAKAGVILAGRWQHLAVVVNSAEGRANFFVDGREVTETSGLRHDFKVGGTLLIGRRTRGGPLPFDGQLDDLRIYERALSAAEISALSAP